MMKMLAAAVALATLVTFPAFAQSYDPDIGTGNTGANPDAGTGNWGGPAAASAQAYPGSYGSYAQAYPYFGYDAYAQAYPFGGGAPATPFYYKPGSYGTFASSDIPRFGTVDYGDYSARAEVPLRSGRHAHPKVRRYHRG